VFYGLVSIPIGFSSSLQRCIWVAWRTPSPSFNPYRVFKFAATIAFKEFYYDSTKFQSLSGFQVRCNFGRRWGAGVRAIWFQSLSGFQVRCNLGAAVKEYASRHVSIPIGFSSSLQRSDPQVNVEVALKFQSLSGFQVRCNPWCWHPCPAADRRSFNPYRVFKFAATGLATGDALTNRWFQSLSGFQVRCNSIFFVYIWMLLAEFQSLSGFQVRCNERSV